MNSRPLMFAASSVWMALLLVIFVFRGGGTTPVEPPATPFVPSLIQQAAQMAALGEYGAAAVKYQAAVEQDPDNISLRFALGTALSHVGRQEETVEQFRRVVTRGNPDSSEVQMARRWLISAGVIVGDVTFAPAPADEAVSPQAETPVPPARVGTGTAGVVRGRTELSGRPREVHLVLGSSEEAKKNMALTKTVKLGEPFRFDNVPPGSYRLTVEDPEGDALLWDLEVTVTPGKETVVSLSNA